jgi:hypothetical protein
LIAEYQTKLPDRIKLPKLSFNILCQLMQVQATSLVYKKLY